MNKVEEMQGKDSKVVDEREHYREGRSVDSV